MLEEREAPEARRAGCVCRGVLSSSGQNAMVQDKDQGRFSSCPAVPQSPHKTVTVKKALSLFYANPVGMEAQSMGGAVLSLLMGPSTHPRLLLK